MAPTKQMSSTVAMVDRWRVSMINEDGRFHGNAWRRIETILQAYDVLPGMPRVLRRQTPTNNISASSPYQYYRVYARVQFWDHSCAFSTE